MPTLPALYVELYTRECPEGRCHFFSFVNHPTPSGVDRPYLTQSSRQPLLLDRLVASLRPGCTYFLDGVAHVRDESPTVPYTERDVSGG